MDVRRAQEDNMAEVIGVRFKEVGKVYYFDPQGNKLRSGDMVIEGPHTTATVFWQRER